MPHSNDEQSRRPGRTGRTGRTGAPVAPVAVDVDLCAHARAGITGCSRCADACPVSALATAGEAMRPDPATCEGCGLCVAVCPTGAIAVTEAPAVTAAGLTAAIDAARGGGNGAPFPVLAAPGDGLERLRLALEYAGDPPGMVVPLPAALPAALPPDLVLVALARGAARIGVALDGRDAAVAAGLREIAGIVDAIMAGLGYGGGRLHVLDEADPEILARRLRALPAPDAPPAGDFATTGSRGAVFRLAIGHLADHAPAAPAWPLALPGPAPWGTVAVDAAGCTLCMACVGACPTGALRASTGPAGSAGLAIVESACVQCGLCVATCPESVIRLHPRLATPEAGLAQVRLVDGDWLACSRCGRPFAPRAAVQKVMAMLAGNPVLDDEAARARLLHCPECRILNAGSHGSDPV